LVWCSGFKYTRPINIVGEATTPDQSKPAELKVKFSEFDKSTAANYFIIETDYDDVAVVFSCSEINVPFFPLNIQFAWILTRQQGVAPSNINDIMDKLTSFGVDVKKFKTVDQKDCPNV
jgi:lipocalin